MSFSFEPTRATALDRVRGALTDWPESDALLSNEAISAVLTDWGSSAGAAEKDQEAETGAIRQLASEMIMTLSKKPTAFARSGGVSISWGNRIAGLTAIRDGKVVIGGPFSTPWGTPVLVGTGSFSRPEMEG